MRKILIVGITLILLFVMGCTDQENNFTRKSQDALASLRTKISVYIDEMFPRIEIVRLDVNEHIEILAQEITVDRGEFLFIDHSDIKHSAGGEFMLKMYQDGEWIPLLFPENSSFASLGIVLEGEILIHYNWRVLGPERRGLSAGKYRLYDTLTAVDAGYWDNIDIIFEFIIEHDAS